MQIAVTGGSGELGRSLVLYLVEQGHSVVSIDRAPPPMTGGPPGGNVRHLAANTTNFGEVVAGLTGCTAVIRLAAHRAPGGSPDSVVYVDNTAGSYHVLSAAASLRFHLLVENRERAVQVSERFGDGAVRHLWAHTLLREASRACLLSVTADTAGHEVFCSTAPRTVAAEPSLDLARRHYPNTPIQGDFSDHKSFFNCAKAERLLAWRHAD